MSLISRIPKIGCEILPKIVSAATSDDVEINLVALSCLQKLLITKTTNFDVYRFLYKEDILNKLLKNTTTNSSETISLTSNICRLITRKLNIQEQKDILQNYSSVLEGNILDSDIALIDGIMISLNPDIELKNKELITNLYKIAISLNPSVRLASCHLIAVLINKMKLNEEYEQILQFLKDNIQHCLDSAEEKIEVKKAAAYLLNWLTISLVKSGSKNSQDFLNYVCIIFQVSF